MYAQVKTIGFIVLKRIFFFPRGKWNTFSFVRLLFYNILGRVDFSSSLLFFFRSEVCGISCGGNVYINIHDDKNIIRCHAVFGGGGGVVGDSGMCVCTCGGRNETLYIIMTQSSK